MVDRLIPLKDIPYAARESEAAARREIRAKGLDPLAESDVEIVLAPGCHGEPFPPTVGWVVTPEAGLALAARRTHMPDGSSHCRLRVLP